MFKEESFWWDIAPALLIILVLTALLVYFALPLTVLGLVAVLIVIWLAKRRQRKRELKLARYLDDITNNIERATFFALSELPIAIAVFDEKGGLRWQNNLLAEWFFDREKFDDINDVLPGLSLEKIEADKGEIIYKKEEKIYNIFHRKVQMDEATGEKILLLYIRDITQVENMRLKFDESRLVVAHLQFDNYNNVLKGLSDSQRENVKAEVNKLVGAWVEEVNGFYRQHTDDMYFVVMHRKSLEEEMKKKFEILDRMRGIKMGNKLPVTFSFGVSCDGENVVDIGEKAQSCLDMALSRGGDQVAVSFDGNISFFGGMTMAQEKNTRVGARSAAHVIKEIISNAEMVFVAGHINEDFDSIGAAVGVAKMAMIVGRPVYIINSEQGMALTKFKELAEPYDNYKDILITDDEAVGDVPAGSLLVLVDHHRPVLCAAPKLLKTVKNKIIIDHHRRAEDFISDTIFTYQEPAASSSCELVTELLTYFDDNVEYNRLEASILYAGIVVDSKNFALQTGARTFEAAATLRLAGADPSMVRQLFSEDIELVKNKAKIVENIEILFDGIIGMASVRLPAKGQSSVAIAQVADSMLNMEGIKASFVLGQLEEEVVVSARSTGKINVQLIMEELGGGGHQTVAGVKIKNADIEELKTQIIELVSKQMEETETNENNITARRQEVG